LFIVKRYKMNEDNEVGLCINLKIIFIVVEVSKSMNLSLIFMPLLFDVNEYNIINLKTQIHNNIFKLLCF